MTNTVCEIPTKLDLDVRLLEGSLSSGAILIDSELDIGSGGRLPNYEGSYSVTPKVYEQTLATKNKSMVDDVTVEEIPYSDQQSYIRKQHTDGPDTR